MHEMDIAAKISCVVTAVGTFTVAEQVDLINFQLFQYW